MRNTLPKLRKRCVFSKDFDDIVAFHFSRRLSEGLLGDKVAKRLGYAFSILPALIALALTHMRLT